MSRGAEMTEPLNTGEKRAVILLSGGLDSATVVAMARAEGYACYTMSFDYGQRSHAELHAAVRVARDLGVVEHKVIGLNLNGMGGSALTDTSIDIPEALGEGIPVTYVPARNTVALRIAGLDPLKATRRREGQDASHELQGVGGIPPAVSEPLEQVQIDHTVIDDGWHGDGSHRFRQPYRRRRHDDHGTFDDHAGHEYGRLHDQCPA